MITKRDMKVIDAIKQFKIMGTNTIYQLFYPSEKNTKRMAQRRLKVMIDEGLLARERQMTCMEYMYYIPKKKPRQKRHCFIRSELYGKLVEIGLDVSRFIPEIDIGDIRADGVLGYVNPIFDKKHLYLLEVEISNNKWDRTLDKYLDLFYTKKYKELFNKMPNVLVVTNKNIKQPPNGEFKFIQIKEDFSNIRDLLKI